MKVLKWIGMFFLLGAIGTLLAVVGELFFAMAIGLPFNKYSSGFIVMTVITFGLIIYGTRK